MVLGQPFGSTDFGVSAYDGGSRGGRQFKDWKYEDYDAQDIWRGDAAVIGGRSADALRNNAIYAALHNTMRDGVVGPEGLRFKSGYRLPQVDHSAEDEADRKARLDQEQDLANAIDRCVAGGLADTSIDAGGLLTWSMLQVVALATKGVYGEFFAERVLKPHRPGRHTHATCWRVIHPARVVHPPASVIPAGEEVKDGIGLDMDGVPVAIYVASKHPNAVMSGDISVLRVPIYTADGMRNVIWYACRKSPEQLRGIGWIGPVMTLLRHLDKTTEAHVLVKRLQSCIGMIVEVDDPHQAARKNPNGKVLTYRTKMEPGQIYFVGRGFKGMHPLDFKYSGQDFEAFTNQLLRLICAAFGPGAPFQAVLKQLTQANLASSRAALMQMWRAMRGEQEEMISYLGRPIIQSILAEDIARGRLVLPTGDDLVAAMAGKWLLPPKLSVDDYRDWQAAKTATELGVSRTTALAQHDLDADHEAELRRREQDRDDALGLGPIAPTPTTEPVDDPNDKDNADEQDDARQAVPVGADEEDA